MQITLVSSGDTVSDVLNRFETKFFPECPDDEFKKKFGRSLVAVSECLITYSIRELKAMTDFIATAFTLTGLTPPKRNSKVSLAGWIAQVLLSARKVAEASGAIGAQSGQHTSDKNYWCPQCDEWMDRSGFNEVLGSDFQEQLCKVCGSEVGHEFDENSPATVDISSSEVEVLEPEEKPVYTISIIADGSFSEERVNRLPPYLIDRKGNLLKRFWHRSCDAGYSEITSKHLSNIAVDSGLVIKLMSDNLEVSQSCIIGDPPPFIVDRGAAYKRDQLRRGLAVSYSQVISEYLSNIVVV